MTSFWLFLVTFPCFLFNSACSFSSFWDFSVPSPHTDIFSFTQIMMSFFNLCLFCFLYCSHLLHPDVLFSSPVVIRVWTVTQYYSATFFLSLCIPKRSNMVVLVPLTLAFSMCSFWYCIILFSLIIYYLSIAVIPNLEWKLWMQSAYIFISVQYSLSCTPNGSLYRH